MLEHIDIPVLFVAGLPCSGKTEFVNVAETMPLLCIEWSQVLREALSSYRKATDRGTALKLVEDIVKEKGSSYFPERILHVINRQLESSPGTYQGVVVSGARNPTELQILAKLFAKSLVVMLCADYHTRYQRSKERGRTKDPTNIEEFVRNDFAELNTGIATIADELAQELIFNDGELAEFAAQVRSLLASYFLINV